MEQQSRLDNATQRSVQYLAEKMRCFLRFNDHAVICFPNEKQTDLGSLFSTAVTLCGAKPIVWGEDHRWKTLLRTVFDHKACTLIAPPLVILGITKLARATQTPIHISNVVTAGYPCTDWMIEGIRGGLDCKSWGCFDVAHEVVVGGFSCREGRGVHLNSQEFDVGIWNERDEELPKGSMGAVVLRNRLDGSVVRTCDLGRVSSKGCKCGSSEPLLVDLSLGANVDMELVELSHSLQRWTSVLDCRVARGEGGLEIEIVAFPGEKLPQLPSCAKLILRPWEPEKDEPFHLNVLKSPPE